MFFTNADELFAPWVNMGKHVALNAYVITLFVIMSAGSVCDSKNSKVAPCGEMRPRGRVYPTLCDFATTWA